MARANRQNFGHKFLISFLLFIGLFVGIFVFTQTNIKFDQRGKAAPVNTCGRLAVRVSADGVSASNQISISNPARYYLHVTSNGQPCETSFDIYSQYCDLNNVCQPWKEKKPWLSYRSDNRGIARIDNQESTRTPLAPGTYTARYKPAGSQYDWSDPVIVRVGTTEQLRQSTSQDTTQSINLAEYYNAKPGHTYIYTSRNNISNKTGKTRIQMEEEMNWCGYRILPWRFTKNLIDAYHYPWRFATPWTPSLAPDRDTVMRWLYISPSYSFTSPLTAYNNYITAIGEKRYTRKDIRDVVANNLLFISMNGGVSSEFPAYNLGLKSGMTVPYYFYGDASKYFNVYHKNTPGTSPSSCPQQGTSTALFQSGAQPAQAWRIRADFENISIQGARYSYNGRALRLDFFEKGYPTSLDEGGLLRESWYLVKGVGVVKIVQKNFNYGGAAPNYYWGIDPAISTNCKDDVDCRSDLFTRPHVVTTLDEYYLNPTLQVAVSKDGSSYTNEVTVKKTDGYYLKITNTPYTGYIEVLTPSTGAKKWDWAENGVVRVTPDQLTTTTPGRYARKFRVWVPDDQYPNEQRVTDTNLPWSNEIVVNIQ